MSQFLRHKAIVFIRNLHPKFQLIEEELDLVAVVVSKSSFLIRHFINLVGHLEGLILISGFLIRMRFFVFRFNLVVKHSFGEVFEAQSEVDSLLLFVLTFHFQQKFLTKPSQHYPITLLTHNSLFFIKTVFKIF